MKDTNQKITLGSTGIVVMRNGFGALPIQRISTEEAVHLIRKAYRNGFNFYDTARFYTDSEEKIGLALHDVREEIVIASKTMAKQVEEFWEQLHTSLSLLKTDYLDLYQFHNPPVCFKPGDGTGLYEAMVEAKRQGLIRHIGITNHRLAVAMEAANSGLYETIQYPFNYLATDEEIELVKLCKEKNIGFIAMKALSGGLITDSAAAYAFLACYDHVLPIWGIQREKELDEFIAHGQNPPELTQKIQRMMKVDQEALRKSFCRGCGYCLPCPAGIDIPNVARMSLMIRRAPVSVYLEEPFIGKMKQVEDCIHCDHCKDHCPYNLNTPQLIVENYEDYKNFI